MEAVYKLHKYLWDCDSERELELQFLASVCFKEMWFTSAPTVSEKTPTQLLAYDLER